MGCNITVFSVCTPLCGAAAQAQQQQASPQATFTPVGCNITVFSVCTPLCGADAQAQQQASPQATFTPVGCNITVFSVCTPLCGADAQAQQQQASPQATFTPVGCNITVFSVCTPLCGANAAQHGGAYPLPRTLGINCPPQTLLGPHCPGPGPITQSPATICPVHTHQFICNLQTHPAICHHIPNTTIITTTHPVSMACHPGGGGINQQGANPQATFGPIQCNVTVFSICTPLCGG